MGNASNIQKPGLENCYGFSCKKSSVNKEADFEPEKNDIVHKQTDSSKKSKGSSNGVSKSKASTGYHHNDSTQVQSLMLEQNGNWISLDHWSRQRQSKFDINNLAETLVEC